MTDWIDVSSLSFNTLLLLERVQLSWFPGWRWTSEADLAVALQANPAIEWYLRHKCPEIGGWVDRLQMAYPAGPVHPDEVRRAEVAVLHDLDDLVTYAVDPAIYDAQPFLGWDPRELTFLVDFMGKTVIDVGAGTGRLTLLAAGNGAASVFAVEPVANLRRYLKQAARSRGLSNIFPVDGLITDIPFPDAIADVVMGGHVFGDDPETEYAEMERVTKPGGVIILCPGNDDRDDERHHFLETRGFRWSRFEEPGDGMKRKYWLRMNSQPDTHKPAETGSSRASAQPASNESGAPLPTFSRLALVNGRIALPDAIVEGQAVVVEHGIILGIANPADLGSDTERLDVGGRLITPGLIDIHIHGALGHTFNEPDAAAWEIVLRENARRGVTSLVATFAPEPIPNLIACLEFARSWTSSSLRGAPSAPKQSRSPATEEIASQKPLAMTRISGTRVLGAHLESPYVSPMQKGALDPTAMRSPDDGSVDVLLEYADILRIFVLAPELPGALALIERLAGLGILPAAGHTSATDEQVAEAMRAGLRHVTHIWSAMSSTVREGPWRKPGVLEAALVFDGLTVEMIADNRHLPHTLMKLAYKCIGPDRLCAVSDASNGAGLPPGARYRMGNMEYVVGDGVGMMLDNSAFAGSTTLLNQMIPILHDVVGIPLVEAIRMVTLTPARAIGMDASIGSISSGRRADLAIFEDDFSAWRVMIGGRWANQQIGK